MANKQRGEVVFALSSPQGDKVDFVARPTFALVAEIEDALNCSILQAVARIRSGALTFTDTVKVAAVAAKHARPAPEGYEKPEFREALFRCGPLNVMGCVRDLIGEAMVTGEPEKNAEGAAKK